MYAVIDIGSNTIRMVLYKVVNGELRQMLNSKEPAGLVGYVENGRLTGEGIDKLTDTLSHFKLILESVRVKKVLPFATASLRNIENRDEALSAVQKTCGWRVRVLSGLEEAMCDYYGASRLFHAADGLLCDVGGGSTELVYFTKRKAVLGVSLPIGSLTLYNRFVDGILPSRGEVRKIEAEAAAQIEAARLRIRSGAAKQIVAVGGTARAALKLRNSLEGKSGNSAYETSFYGDFLSQMEMGPEKLTGRILKIAPERIHTITPGVAVLHTVAKTFGCRTVVTSPYGVREGYLYYLLKERGILHGKQP